MFQQRLQKLYAALQEASLDAIVLNPSPTQRYLTGLSFHLMERPTVLILAPGHQPIFILANLETSRLAQAAFPIHAVSYGDNPATWPEAFARAAALMGKSIRKIGVEPNWLRFLELKYLESAFPQAQWVNAEGVVSALRMQKDEQEIALMRRAVEIAQKALIATLPIIHPGITENQIAAELVNQILRHGADTHLPFAPIVAAGPIAGLLSGAATGGIAGGLLDWGIPAPRGRHYEERVKQGNVLVSVRTGDDRVLMAADILRRHGAQDVETY